MEASIKSAVDAWLSDPAIAEEYKAEVRTLLNQGNEKELTDRFYRELEFGTAGLRGIIGAGLNRMNIYTVGAATQGLANYIRKQGEAAMKAGVAIAYDCRHKSDLFAQRTAGVLAANGIRAYVFEKLRPTPELSFAVRHLGCTSGVVITASHNPPAYNGYKVYWAGGVQVVPPHDKNIIEEVRQVGGFARVRAMSFEAGVSEGHIQVIGPDVDEAFLSAVQASCLNEKACREQGARLKVVFTSLHGTGGTLIPDALHRRGFQQLLEVPEQAVPDGDFPTVKSPNPEEGEALDMGIQLAQREGADLVIGSDPDADRMGIAVRAPSGEFELVTGNQIGSLLTWYVCEQLTRSGRFPKNGVVISTIVSGDLMKTIGRAYGAEVIETLTGFKWIGAKVAQFEAEGSPAKPSKTYLFGSEESYGYMPATYVRDKDAVTSAAWIVELAAVLAAEGRSLHGLLQDLFRQYGYHRESTLNITLPGKEGAARIQSIMAELRNNPPRSIAGLAVTTFGDVQSGEIRDLRSGQTTGRYDLPASNVLLLTLEDGSKVIARPSGTEPKIKFYILVKEPPSADVGAAKSRADRKAESIAADVSRLAGV